MTIGVLDLEAVLSGGRVPQPVLAVGAAEGGRRRPAATGPASSTSRWSTWPASARRRHRRGERPARWWWSCPRRSSRTPAPPTCPGTPSSPTSAQPPFFDQHPFLVWQMVRVNGRSPRADRPQRSQARFPDQQRRLRRRRLFTDPHILGLGCADIYATVSNNLPPRTRSAFRGHRLDRDLGPLRRHPQPLRLNGDCVQDFSGAGENTFTHGMKVAETDLQVAGADLLHRGLLHRPRRHQHLQQHGLPPRHSGQAAASWTFANGPSLPYTVGPGHQRLGEPDGSGAECRQPSARHRRGARAARGPRHRRGRAVPGRQRFAYALQNHDFDRRIRRFHVPFNTTGGVDETSSIPTATVCRQRLDATADATG